jgi:(S)-3,5-dihydroxyphenylglycine transaminase
MLETRDLNLRVLDPSLDAMNLLNEIRERFPDAISFAAGRPVETYFRVQEALSGIEPFARSRAKGRAGSPLDALSQYGATNGIIQEELARLLSRDEGIELDPGAILVTVGCQEAMVICLIGLCRPAEDVGRAADPGYIGVTGVAKLLGIELCPVHSGPDGLDLDDLRDKLRGIRQRGKRPKLLYDIPDYANPSGASMPLGVRRALLEIARAEGLLILEDAVYRAFSYDEDPPPSLKALDRDRRVIQLGTFAKSIFPGARVGYLAADQTVTDGGREVALTAYLSKVKSLLTVNTPPLNQALVAGVLRAEGGSLRHHVEPQIACYRRNRDVLLACLERTFPAAEPWTRGIHWNRPRGGFFLVLTLPFPADDALLSRSASDYGVVWVPLRHFCLGTGGTHQMRLSFSAVNENEITEGVARLGRLVRDHLLSPRSPG